MKFAANCCKNRMQDLHAMNTRLAASSAPPSQPIGKLYTAYIEKP